MDFFAPKELFNPLTTVGIPIAILCDEAKLLAKTIAIIFCDYFAGSQRVKDSKSSIDDLRYFVIP